MVLESGETALLSPKEYRSHRRQVPRPGTGLCRLLRRLRGSGCLNSRAGLGRWSVSVPVLVWGATPPQLPSMTACVGLGSRYSNSSPQSWLLAAARGPELWSLTSGP